MSRYERKPQSPTALLKIKKDRLFEIIIYDSALSIKQLAERLGVTNETISKWKKEFQNG